jgi:hypothetical protein
VANYFPPKEIELWDYCVNPDNKTWDEMIKKPSLQPFSKHLFICLKSIDDWVLADLKRKQLARRLSAKSVR